jgi:hypothetical protein
MPLTEVCTRNNNDRTPNKLKRLFVCFRQSYRFANKEFLSSSALASSRGNIASGRTEALVVARINANGL